MLWVGADIVGGAGFESSSAGVEEGAGVLVLADADAAADVE